MTRSRRRAAAACMPCSEGDVLRMGEYRIQVHIDADGACPPPGTNTMAQMRVDNVTPLRAANQRHRSRGITQH